jgi:hypothetical protein
MGCAGVRQPLPSKGGRRVRRKLITARDERTEVRQTRKDVGRTEELDDEIAHCDREIASLKRHPEKNGINHDVMLAE